jgi:thymidylate synthase
MNQEEQQYISLIKEIIHKGTLEKGRNGNTYSTFGYSMKFSLEENFIPMLTTKKLSWKTCIKELLWFIRGNTNNKILNSQGVHIWDGNASKEFLKSRGLEYEEGILGPIYGFQWRHFNGDYKNQTGGIDQLQYIIDQLKNPETRNSRRLVMSSWNPCQIDQMALPPCHMICQFHVREGKYLSCALFQRSGDIGLGVPFNIASYSLLTHILAKHCGLEADEFVHFLGNCHIYKDHLMALKIQIERNPFDFPEIEICNKHNNIDDYNISDIKWVNPYLSHSSIKMKMQA